MKKTKCPECMKTRELTEPCGHCGAGACAGKPSPSAPIPFDELEPLDSPPPPRRQPPTGEVLLRYSALLDESPVFAGSDVQVVQPIDAESLSVDIGAKYEVPSAPADAEPLVHVLLTLTPDGPPLLDPAAGPVAHVVLALDVSASMNAPDKYPVLTEALAGMLYELRSPASAEVLVSVVVFAYGSATLLRAVSSKSLDPREVLAEIDRSPLRFGRYTDVVGALNKAGVVAAESLRANRAMPVRIYLLTDGRPQDVEGAHEVLAKIARMPIDVDGLAFGADADVRTLQELVSGGRGGTVKQVRSETLSEAFGRIGEVAQRVVANRALFELELSPGVVGGAAFRFRPARHAYGDNAFAGGTKFSADLGTLESSRPYTLLFELRLPRARAGSETAIGRVCLRLPGFGSPRTFGLSLALPRHDGETAAIDPEVAAARDVLTALAGDDPQATLRALRVRRAIYIEERRDRHVLGVIDKAITELEERGTLATLSAAEHATLLSHTCTAGSAGARTARRARTPSSAR